MRKKYFNLIKGKYMFYRFTQASKIFWVTVKICEGLASPGKSTIIRRDFGAGVLKLFGTTWRVFKFFSLSKIPPP